jgi:hypothetical protein
MKPKIRTGFAQGREVLLFLYCLPCPLTHSLFIPPLLLSRLVVVVTIMMEVLVCGMVWPHPDHGDKREAYASVAPQSRWIVVQL